MSEQQNDQAPHADNTPAKLVDDSGVERKVYWLSLETDGEEPLNVGSIDLTEDQAEAMSTAVGALWNAAIEALNSNQQPLRLTGDLAEVERMLRTIKRNFNTDCDRWLEAMRSSDSEA